MVECFYNYSTIHNYSTPTIIPHLQSYHPYNHTTPTIIPPLRGCRGIRCCFSTIISHLQSFHPFGVALVVLNLFSTIIPSSTIIPPLRGWLGSSEFVFYNHFIPSGFFPNQFGKCDLSTFKIPTGCHYCSKPYLKCDQNPEGVT